MTMLRACRAMRFGLEAKSEEDLSTAVNDDNDDNEDDDGTPSNRMRWPRWLTAMSLRF